MVKTATPWSDAFLSGLSGRSNPIGPKFDQIEQWLAVAREVILAEAELAEALAPFAVDNDELERAKRIARSCRRAADEIAEATHCPTWARPLRRAARQLKGKRE